MIKKQFWIICIRVDIKTSSIFGYSMTRQWKNFTNRISIFDSLFKGNDAESFLKRLIDGHDKWIVVNDNVPKRMVTSNGLSCTNSGKGRIDAKYNVLWSFVTSSLYCQQLMLSKCTTAAQWSIGISWQCQATHIFKVSVDWEDSRNNFIACILPGTATIGCRCL